MAWRVVDAAHALRHAVAKGAQPYEGSDKTLDVHLCWLRRKLGESGTAPRYVRTVRGVGVRLVDPGT